jgi:hypothetical protein
MTEDDFLRTLPLADRLRTAAVDLAATGAPRALVAAVREAAERLAPASRWFLGRGEYYGQGLGSRVSAGRRGSIVVGPQRRDAYYGTWQLVAFGRSGGTR